MDVASSTYDNFLGAIKMSHHKKYKHESQDARRHDQQHATHPDERETKHQSKTNNKQVPKANTHRK